MQVDCRHRRLIEVLIPLTLTSIANETNVKRGSGSRRTVSLGRFARIVRSPLGVVCLAALVCSFSSLAAESTPARSGIALYSSYRCFTSAVGVLVAVQMLLIVGLLWNRRRATDVLRRNEGLLRTVTDHSHVGLAMLDADRRYIFANAAYAELLDLSVTNIIGKCVEEALPYLYCRISEHLDRAFAGERVSYERTVPGDSGSEDGRGDRCYAVMYQPLHNSGEVTGVTVTVVDITDRRRIEEALRQSEQRFRLMGETIPYGVWMTDARGDIAYLSEALLQLVGMTTKRVREVGWSHLLPKEDVQPVMERWRRCMRTGEDWESELRIRGLDGTRRTILSRGKPVRDSNGQLVAWAGINLDIDDRKRSEEALIRSEKLASTGRLAATMAHEVNNSLAAAMNSVFLAINNADSTKYVRQYLAIADAQLKRIEHITQQALGFYSETTAPANVSVTGVLDSVTELLGRKIGLKQVILEKQYKDQPEVTAVAGELRQVFSTLLINSLDAVEQNGKITLRVSGWRQVGRGSRCVRVTIADNGKGISPSVIPHIFEAFYTTKETVGTGLGLWVGKQIIDKHGGCIRVHTNTRGARRGTTFSVLLPIGGMRAAATTASV